MMSTYHEHLLLHPNIQSQEAAIHCLDTMLRTNGDCAFYGDLSQGLDHLLQSMTVAIEEHEQGYAVSIYPLRNSAGHDFIFHINSKTAGVSHLCIGEVMPDENNEE